MCPSGQVHINTEINYQKSMTYIKLTGMYMCSVNERSMFIVYEMQETTGKSVPRSE